MPPSTHDPARFTVLSHLRDRMRDRLIFDEDVVQAMTGEPEAAVAQRFETAPGERRWHTFSLKMPLPCGAQSLVFILGAGPADDASADSSAHYLDEVHVSVLFPQATLP